MAPKRKADSSDGSASKKRKAITMEVKLDIVKRSDKGETATNIGRSLGLSQGEDVQKCSAERDGGRTEERKTRESLQEQWKMERNKLTEEREKLEKLREAESKVYRACLQEKATKMQEEFEREMEKDRAQLLEKLEASMTSE
ncbi:hypothetical protein MHYP_G00354260 [Metynnis hypsauchen]